MDQNKRTMKKPPSFHANKLIFLFTLHVILLFLYTIFMLTPIKMRSWLLLVDCKVIVQSVE